MYIVYDMNNEINSLRSKYLVLELDTIEFSNGKTIKAFVVIDNEHIPFDEIMQLENLKELHANLIKNYRLKNWNYCKQAIEYLHGKFKGEVDTFYDELSKRIEEYEEEPPEDNWTGNILTDQTLNSE